jgi:glyoxylase-like metal-dependent hydrolase (beta-lactamase superfamily II)
MLEIQNFDGGLLGANTFLVWDTESLDGMIIDCGNLPEAVKSFASQKGVTVKYIVLTHGHYDHAEYTEYFRSAFAGAMLACHRAEAPVLTDSEANVSEYFGEANTYPLPDIALEEGDVLTLGDSETGISFVCLHTPGHTPGSICLYCKKEKTMFTGDTLFNMGYGRTDFKHGSETALFTSLTRLLKMDADIVFYSGHGGSSEIGTQKMFYGI